MRLAKQRQQHSSACADISDSKQSAAARDRACPSGRERGALLHVRERLRVALPSCRVALAHRLHAAHPRRLQDGVRVAAAKAEGAHAAAAADDGAMGAMGAMGSRHAAAHEGLTTPRPPFVTLSWPFWLAASTTHASRSSANVCS